MKIDTAVELLEEAANFMRGVALDPRVPRDTAEALRNKCAEIDKLTEEHEEVQYKSEEGA